jgi:hypothetical protein
MILAPAPYFVDVSTGRMTLIDCAGLVAYANQDISVGESCPGKGLDCPNHVLFAKNQVHCFMISQRLYSRLRIPVNRRRTIDDFDR